MADERVYGGDDGPLLARVARSDVAAFEAVYDRYNGSVYSLAHGMLRDVQAAQEVTQDVFLGIWRGAHAFDPQRGGVRSWILALAHHKCVDALRRQRRHASVPLPEAMTDEHADVVSEALQRVEAARIQQALGALSADQRTAIVLAYYGGYTQREISERLGAPLGTVKTRMRDGLLRLRQVLEASVEETRR